MKISCLFLFFCLPLFGSDNSVRIFIKGKAVISEKEIRLSQISQWRGEKDPILWRDLDFPKFVTKKELTEILSKEFSEEVTVLGQDIWILPKTRHWNQKDILSFLKESQNSLSSEKQFRITFGAESFLSPNGLEPQIRKKNLLTSPGKKMIPIEFTKNGDVLHIEYLPILIEEQKKAYFAKRNIPKRIQITSDDIEERAFFSADSNREYVTENPIGKTTLVELRENAPLEKKQIRTLYPVERGQEVSLYYITGNLMVKMRTRALVSGNVGETITVLNPSTMKVLKAKIQEEGICILEENGT